LILCYLETLTPRNPVSLFQIALQLEQAVARNQDSVRSGGRVAIMTYRYTSKEKYKGREEAGMFRITRVFIRMRNGLADGSRA
jgi:hypothetical protein